MNPVKNWFLLASFCCTIDNIKILNIQFGSSFFSSSSFLQEALDEDVCYPMHYQG
jgi:hypothetical protein